MRRLVSEAAPAARLGPGERAELFELFARHYDGASRAAFESDLSRKDYVLLLRDPSRGAVAGFSTQEVSSTRAGVLDLRVIFSGDTVIDRAYWGHQELVRAWCRFAGQVLAERPRERLFWLLIVKGFRTYLYLPLFFRDYHPRHDAPTPAFERDLVAALARERFPGHYDEASGLLEFGGLKDRLEPALAAVPPSRSADPRVRFFLERNPRYDRGDELVCLTEVSRSNMRGPALRALEEGLRLGPLRAATATDAR